LVAVAVLALAVASVPAHAGGGPRPRGGTNRCLTSTNDSDVGWLNQSAAQLQEALNAKKGTDTSTTILSGRYSATFVDGSMVVTIALTQRADTTIGEALLQGVAEYQVRGHFIVIDAVTEDRGTIHFTRPPDLDFTTQQNGTIFGGGAGGRIGFTCTRSELTLFLGGRQVLRLH